MKILIGKLFEYVVIAGVVTFLGLVFLYEIVEHTVGTLTESEDTNW